MAMARRTSERAFSSNACELHQIARLKLERAHLTGLSEPINMRTPKQKETNLPWHFRDRARGASGAKHLTRQISPINAPKSQVEELGLDLTDMRVASVP